MARWTKGRDAFGLEIDVRLPDDPDDDPTSEGRANVWADDGAAASWAARQIAEERERNAALVDPSDPDEDTVGP